MRVTLNVRLFVAGVIGHFPAIPTLKLPDAEAQNEVDAQALYRLLEEQVVPEFYDRGPDGLPQRWIARALRSVATIPGVFNTDRMVGEYFDWGYAPADAASRQG